MTNKIRICAVLGNESHSTSKGWSKLTVNGVKVTWRDAAAKEWKTKPGDKHATWCECIFEVNDGTRIEWEAAANQGPNGREKTRINQSFIADSGAPVFSTASPGYPARDAILSGRLRLESDQNAENKANFQSLKENL